MLTIVAIFAVGLATACQPDVEPPEPTEPVIPNARVTSGGEAL